MKKANIQGNDSNADEPAVKKSDEWFWHFDSVVEKEQH
jgi:hypothetical protein